MAWRDIICRPCERPYCHMEPAPPDCGFHECPVELDYPCPLRDLFPATEE